MDFEAVKERLAEAYTAVQNLQIQPTKVNVELLSQIMRNLDESYAALEKAQSTDAAGAKEEEK